MALFGESTTGIANQDKTVKCPFCDEPVKHNQEHDFYKCPLCGCEIWPEQEEQGTDPLEGSAEAYIDWVHPVSRKRSSSNRSGRKRKKPKRRPQKISDKYLFR